MPPSRLWTAAQVLRHFGPGWVAFRAWHAAKLKAGWFTWKFPGQDWAACPLADQLGKPGLAQPEAYVAYRRERAPRFFFAESDRDRFRAQLSRWDTTEADPVAHARRIAAGEFLFFSKTWHDCGLPPDWHRNPFTGQRAPAEAHWSRMKAFAHGDIKCIWELSRFSFAYTLVRAYGRDGDDRWADLFWRLLEDWRAHNPPQRGPQWMCGQETAFRVMAWCFALHGFLRSPATTPARVAMLAPMLAVSGQRIAANFHYALSQANNHGISEALGLWTLGALFPEFRRSAVWEKQGRHWLERLGRELIYADGGFAQHSTNYQRLVLHDYLLAVRLGDLHERPFSAELKARVAKAGDFLCQLEDERSGGVPCFGPNDGALVLPLNNCDYTDFRPVLQAIAVLSRGERRFRSGPWDEDLLWLFGPEALSAPVRPEERKSLVAAESGFYTLRGRESAAVLRCPRRFRHRPTQADLLHVDLWWRGLNVAADAGSFSYNAPPPWDHALGLTRFHNTVIVDEQDQMRRAGRFLWLPWAQGCVSGVTDGGKLRGWNATHDGYRRLKGKVAHRRRVEGLGGDTWCVLDSVAGEGTHRAMLHWLLADAPFAWEQPGRCLRLDTGEGPFFVCVLVWPGAGEVGLLRADPDSARGWRSRYYQHREPTLSLSVTVTGCGLRFATLFSSDRCLECTVDEAGVRVAAGRGAELLAWP